MVRLREFRLNTLPVSGKLLCTLFLICMGIGFVFSQLNIFYTYSRADGIAGFSFQDIVLTYYGQPDVLLVESKLNGTMREHLENEYERNSLINWAKGGAKKGKSTEAKSIILKNCLLCHTAGGDAAFAPFDTLSTVSAIFTRINNGISIPRLITLSHIHMISIGVLFAISGIIFLFTPINEKLKMILLIFPFGSLLMDVFSWWLTKLIPVFAIAVFIGGVFTVISFFIQFVISLLTMWKSSGKST